MKTQAEIRARIAEAEKRLEVLRLQTTGTKPSMLNLHLWLSIMRLEAEIVALEWACGLK